MWPVRLSPRQGYPQRNSNYSNSQKDSKFLEPPAPVMLLHSTFAFYLALLALDKALRPLGLWDPHHPGKLLGFPRHDIHQPKDSSFKTQDMHLMKTGVTNEKQNDKKTTKKWQKIETPYRSIDVCPKIMSKLIHLTVLWRCCILCTFWILIFQLYALFFVSAPGLSMTLLHFCVGAWHCRDPKSTYGNHPFLPLIPGSSSSTGASTGLPQLVNFQYHLEDWWILSTYI